MNEYQEHLYATVRDCSQALKQFPKGPLGLTPDSVKATAEYRQAKQAYADAFAKLRAFNAEKARV